MDKPALLTRIRECKEEIEAIDRQNGELMVEIQQIQKQLELARSRAATWETKAKEGNSWQTYASAILVLLGSLIYLFR
jgi:F0F1-type ATP synthase membrane subunit b/b'